MTPVQNPGTGNPDSGLPQPRAASEPDVGFRAGLNPVTVLLLLVLPLIGFLGAACGRRGGSAKPDLAIFASGSLFGQLEPCG